MRILVSIILLSLLLTGCSDHSETVSPADEVVALVNGVPVLKSRLAYELEQIPGEKTEEQRNERLERLTKRIALADKARELGILNDPLVQQVVEGILISRLKEEKLYPLIEAIEVSHEEISSWYQANLDSFTRPERLQVAVLWFDTRGKAPLEKRYNDRLEKARDSVLAGEVPVKNGFGSLAITTSEHSSSRFKGGILDWLEAGSYSDAFRQTVYSLANKLNAPGAVSDLHVSEAGSFLVRLVQIEPETIQPLAVVSTSIERQLRKERQKQIEATFEEAMLQDAEIKIFKTP